MNNYDDMNQKSNMIIYTTEDGLTKIETTFDEDTVWLSIDQMAELFQRDKSTISRHIKNVFSEGELQRESVVANFATTASDNKTYRVDYYNLDVIISVGYRVKSPRGVLFRKWATNVLRQYLTDGYALNEKRLAVLNKTVQIQSNIIGGLVGIDAEDVLKVVQEYSRSLELLDAYDHQCVAIPEGSECSYLLKYDECMKLIKSMEFSQTSDVFGVEKESGKLEGILSAIYQSAFGQDAYPSLEEKAANLLYFLVKDHPFNDGCKRIAAALFLYFLNQNNALYNDGNKIISDSALVAITLMIAESRPEEKEIMIQVIINFLHW